MGDQISQDFLPPKFRTPPLAFGLPDGILQPATIPASRTGAAWDNREPLAKKAGVSKPSPSIHTVDFYYVRQFPAHISKSEAYNFDACWFCLGYIVSGKKPFLTSPIQTLGESTVENFAGESCDLALSFGQWSTAIVPAVRPNGHG